MISQGAGTDAVISVQLSSPWLASRAATTGHLRLQEAVSVSFYVLSVFWKTAQHMHVATYILEYCQALCEPKGTEVVQCR